MALYPQVVLRRLEDAAGSQLDVHLVGVFVAGLRSDADAPVPGLDPAAGRQWAPYTRVA